MGERCAPHGAIDVEENCENRVLAAETFGALDQARGHERRNFYGQFLRSLSSFAQNRAKWRNISEKSNRPKALCWSHFQGDWQNFANPCKPHFFTFESSALNRTQPPFLFQGSMPRKEPLNMSYALAFAT